MKNTTPGKLILLTVPIGNLDDITLRNLGALKSGVIFFVEDTRKFSQLLSCYKIEPKGKKIFSFHDHNSEVALTKLSEFLNSGEIVYLVSDAGSPIISDPALPAIKASLKHGFEVESFPGACSPISALELSGLAPIPFHFHGFPPKGKGAKEKWLDEKFSSKGTHICFVGKSDIKDFISKAAQMFPNNQICLARELTKLHQSLYRFRGENWDKISEEIVWKGEFVFLMEQIDESQKMLSNEILELAQSIDKQGAKPKLISKLLANILGKDASELYAKFYSR